MFKDAAFTCLFAILLGFGVVGGLVGVSILLLMWFLLVECGLCILGMFGCGSDLFCVLVLWVDN